MLTTGIVHAMIPTKDLAAARKFYEGTLGFTSDQATPEAVPYRCADGTLFVVYETQVNIPGEATVATWVVSDLDAEVRELKDRGIELLDIEMPGMESEGGIVEGERMRGAWFTDPEGNILGVSQFLS